MRSRVTTTWRSAASSDGRIPPVARGRLPATVELVQPVGDNHLSNGGARSVNSGLIGTATARLPREQPRDWCTFSSGPPPPRPPRGRRGSVRPLKIDQLGPADHEVAMRQRGEYAPIPRSRDAEQILTAVRRAMKRADTESLEVEQLQQHLRRTNNAVTLSGPQSTLNAKRRPAARHPTIVKPDASAPAHSTADYQAHCAPLTSDPPRP